MLRATVGHARAVTFSVRPALREGIMQKTADSVLEISAASHVNTFPNILRE
jgi:hypothetical protein